MGKSLLRQSYASLICLRRVTAYLTRQLDRGSFERQDHSSPLFTPTCSHSSRSSFFLAQLEDELSSRPPPAKRAKTAANLTGAIAPSPAGPSTSSTKADEKKHKAQLKKIFDRSVVACQFLSVLPLTPLLLRLKKECKSDAVKFQGSRKTIKFDELLEKAEFDAIFLGKGRLIQPTPQNKPKSTVTIIEYVTPVSTF